MVVKNSNSYYAYEFFKLFPRLKKNKNYLIQGNEHFFIDKASKMILNEFCDESSDDFDRVVLYGDDVSTGELQDSLDSLPFISEYRTILLKNFDKLNSNSKKILEKYVQNPNPSTILIIIAEKVDGKTKFYKEFVKRGIVINCTPPYSTSDIVRWLRSELSSKKISMDYDALQYFANGMELDFLTASNELTKLILYTKDKAHISLDDVKECIGFSRKNKVFDLQKAIGLLQKKESLRILENLLEYEEKNKIGIFVITILTRFFSKVWRINILRRSDLSDKEIMSNHMKDVFYKFRNEYITYANNYDRNKLRKVFALLLQADIDLKSLNIKPDILLEMLIINILKISE